MDRKVAQFIIKFRIPFIIIILALTGFMMSRFGKIELITDLKDFAPQGHPYVQVQNYMEDWFLGGNMVQITVEVKEGDIFDEKVLSKVMDLTREIYLTEGVIPHRLASIADFKTKLVKGYPDKIDIRKLMQGGIPKTAEKMEELKQAILGDELLIGRLVSPDLKGAIIQADFSQDIDYRLLFGQLRTLQERETGGNIVVRLAGRPVMLGWIDYYQHRLIPIFIAAIFIMAVLLFAAFRSIRAIVLPLLAALISVVWGLGALGITGFKLDPATSLVPFLILGIGVSHSVQLVKRYFEECGHGLTSKEASTKSLSALIYPALTSVITDAAAFATLMLVKVKMLQALAVIGTFGILSIVFNALVFLPCCLSLLPSPKIKVIEEEEKARFLDKTLTLIGRYSTEKKGALVLIGVFLGLIALGVIGTLRMDVGGRAPGAGAFYEGSEYSQNQRAIGEKFPGAITFYIVLEGDGYWDIKNSEVLEDIDAFQQFIEKHPKVGNTLSLTDFLKRMSVVLHEGDESFYHLPRVGSVEKGYCKDLDMLKRRVGEYLVMYTFGEPGEFDFIVDYDYQRSNIQVFLKDMEPGTIREVLQLSKDWMANNWRSKEVTPHIAGGMAGMVGAINEELASGLLSNITQISLIVFFCCVFLLRSFVGAIIVLISLFTRVIITYGVMGFSHIPLTMFTLPVASLGIGIGVDYVIYVIMRIREELPHTQNSDFQVATVKALSTTGRAVFYTVMAVVAGVLVWIASPMKFQMELGLMIGTIIFLNGVGALFLIAPIIFLLKPKFIYRGGDN